MDITQVKGKTWVLEGDELIPLYKIDETHCILLDTGLKVERQDLCDTLDRAGLTPVGILGSHTHWDHSINNFYLREKYGCSVALPLGEAALCSSLEMLQMVYDNQARDRFEELYQDMVGLVDEIVPLSDGTFSFCGVDFEILHVPGHTPDQIAIATPDRVAYVGDALLSGEVLEKAQLPYHVNHVSARKSMERLLSWSYPDWFIAAHRGVFQDKTQVIQGNLAMLDRCGQEILSLMTHPMTVEQINACYLQRAKLTAGSVANNGRYLRNIRRLVEYLVDTKQVSVQVAQGCCYYTRLNRS